MRSAAPREFTGRHMLFVMLAFFGVIVSVNVTMAMFARSSWTGFVVRNSYVASQEFNEKVAAARAQAALGWKAEIALAGGRMTVALSDGRGMPVAATGGTVTFHRPSKEADDVVVALEPASGFVLAGEVALQDGAWVIDASVDVGAADMWRLTRRIVVRDGVLR